MPRESGKVNEGVDVPDVWQPGKHEENYGRNRQVLPEGCVSEIGKR